MKIRTFLTHRLIFIAYALLLTLQFNKGTIMKNLNLLIWALLAAGSLNWGLIGLFDFDLISAVLGNMTIPCRLVYTLIGLAAAYHIVTILTAVARFKMQFRGADKLENCPPINF